jgi:hypothetical protein
MAEIKGSTTNIANKTNALLSYCQYQPYTWIDGTVAAHQMLHVVTLLPLAPRRCVRDSTSKYVLIFEWRADRLSDQQPRV